MEKTSGKCSNGGLVVNFEVLTPIGCLEIDCCSQGLHRLKFKNVLKEEDKDSKYFIRESLDFESLKITNDSSLNQETLRDYKPIQQCIDYLNYYFAYCFTSSKDVENYNEMPSICWSSVCKKDTFSEKVLKTLFSQINLGSTISYKNLASLCGRVNAQRAVGSVMKKNPICLIIPCHRVITSTDNKIGNYNGGVEIKEWLLNYEKNLN